MSEDEISKEFDEWFWPWARAQKHGTMLAHIPTTRAAYLAGRIAALEAAAKACKDEAGRHSDPDCVEACRSCADEVSALKHTPEQSNES